MVVMLASLPAAVVRAEIRVEPASISSPEAERLASGVRDELARGSPKIALLDARISIGHEAFREALDREDRRPIVAAYLTSTEFNAALGGRERPPYVTAIFSDPDPLDQVALARAILANSSIGVFDSPASHGLVRRIATEGVRPIPVRAGQRIDSTLRSADAFDVIIVLDDPTVLNESNIEHVVQLLYRRRQVLIGYSAGLTRVGSLASVYATPEATARGIARVLEQYAASAALPNPTFVDDVEIAVNERLAQSLNIALPKTSELLRAVRVAREEREARR